MPKFIGYITRRCVIFERATVPLDEESNVAARDKLDELAKSGTGLLFERFRGPDYDTAELNVVPDLSDQPVDPAMNPDAPGASPPADPVEDPRV